MNTYVLLFNRDRLVQVNEVGSDDQFARATRAGLLTKPSQNCRNLYVGVDAFHDMSLLENFLALCEDQEMHVHLLTYGQRFSNFEAAKAALLSLIKIRPFSVLSVCEHDQWERVDHTKFEEWLEALKAVGFVKEILYLSNGVSTIPDTLLSLTQVNQECSIYPRKANNILDFLEQKGWPILSSDVFREDTTYPTEQPKAQSLDSKGLLYPMFFNSLVLETTHFCNAKCVHCYTSCGPGIATTRLGVDTWKRIISEAARLNNLSRRCHVGGGEATIFWEEMIEILEHARDVGFSNSIVTNGWWAKNRAAALRKTEQLRAAGVLNIELSVDAMHQKFISTERIVNLISAAGDADVSITLRVCTTSCNKADRVLKGVNNLTDARLTIATSRVTAIGRAKEAVPLNDLFLEDGVPLGSCSNLLNLTVGPNGHVTPCCAGSEICASLRLGNVLEKSLFDIVDQTRSNVFVRSLVHAGPSFFANLLNESGRTNWIKPKYGNICELCVDICSDERLSDLVYTSLMSKIRSTLPEAIKTVAL
jgi:Radical SAM superfamily/Iron-sulfur cluster-binding domain